MGSDSICLAYGVLDRVFSVLRVRRRLLKVLGAASLSLAIKYIEDENNQSYARFLCDVSFKTGFLEIMIEKLISNIAEF